MRKRIALLATAALVGAAAPAPARPHAVGHSERLAARARRGDRLARAALVEEHMGLVRSVARRYRHLGVPLDDLVQEGAIGLLTAVDDYDPARGAGFSTFAFWRVRAAVTHAVTAKGSLVRAPGPVRVVSLEGADRDAVSLGDEPSSESVLLVAEQRNALHRALGVLQPRERAIVSRHFGLDGEPEPLTAIAADLRLSPERTRTLKDEALRTLADELAPARALAGP